MAPKGTQFKPKGHQNDPKGCQRDAKSEPEINKNTTKKRNLEKGRKRGGAVYIFWGHFWPIFAQKMRPKIEAKNDAKKGFKNHEI